MSASPVVAVEQETRPQSVAWAMTAVAVGLAVPRLADDWISNVPYQNLPTTFYIVWAATSVAITFFELGSTWVFATKGPVTRDRVTNLLLAPMSVALAAFLFLANLPYLGAVSETSDGLVLAPPFIDRGLITAMAYLVFGLSLSGVFAWRGLQTTGQVDGRTGSPGRRLAIRALIILVTVAAAYLAWATHMQEVFQN